MNIKTFEYICTLSQKNLKKYAFKELQKTHEDIVFQDGFVFAKGTFPVLLVAHLDTVHEHLPRQIIHDKTKNTLSSPNGIGGDDRCGVYMILELLKKHNCSVVFCEDEEIGAKGAEKFVSYFLDVRSGEIADFNYIVEIDRKGSTDAVFYDCANDDFEAFITEEYFKTSYGTFSDISTIAPMLGISAVNLSSGYYNAHTPSEYVVIPEMDEIMHQIGKLLDRTDLHTQFEYMENVRKSRYYDWGWYTEYDKKYDTKYEYLYDDDDDDDYDDYIGESFYTIHYENRHTTSYECVIARNEYEALGKFFAIHKDVCYTDILDIVEES